MLIQHNLPKTNTNIELKQKFNKQYHNFNNFDTISFKSKIVPTRSFAKQKFINKLLKKNLCKCNLEKLEGAQVGLKSFEGLTMKQIAFALTDLHAITMVSGCTNHCLHCYANAQPYFKRSPYEDFEQLCNDIKELENRTGAKPCYHHGKGYISIGFDTDGLDSHLFDKKGNKHDLIDMAKLVYETTGYKSVFDTNGWDSDEKQKIAEDYVNKLIKDNNHEYFLQINVSINPFNPKYVKALSYGYHPDKDNLYAPFKNISLDQETTREAIPEDLEKARELYTKYIKRTAKTLITFKPILNIGKLGTIVRCINNSTKNMEGFRVDDFKITLQHIVSELSLRQMFGDITEQELEKYIKLLEHIEYNTFSSGRMEKFYKVKNNGSLDGIVNIDLERIAAQYRFKQIKDKEKLSAADKRYLKILAPDGKIYLYDNYRVIPTDIQLKTSILKDKKTFYINI